MNLARVSSNGQITVPVEIRRKLKVKEGDKLIFIENVKGEIVLQNSSKIAIKEAQNEMKDINMSDDDVIEEIMNIRYKESKE